ncbi:Nodulation protein W [Pararobbsia alpina]|uniref:response regulator transcription factor n=1 Tax=Pararobbsia alpina TaxID=621374 RepID=UPI0039A5E529
MDVCTFSVSDKVLAGSLVFVVDDDVSVREAIGSLLESVGIAVEQFEGATDLLARLRMHYAERAGMPNCLVLDIRMPGIGGLELQHHLVALDMHVPIVFVSAFGDISMTVQAMKNGAQDFLVKPFRDQHLLESVQGALRSDQLRRDEDHYAAELRERYTTLSERERRVLALVARGLMNKQIAGELNLSEITIKVHRAQVMRKMKAKTFADLVRMEERVREGSYVDH